MGIWGQNLVTWLLPNWNLDCYESAGFANEKTDCATSLSRKVGADQQKITGNQLSKDQRRINWGWVGNEFGWDRDGTQWVQNDPLVSSWLENAPFGSMIFPFKASFRGIAQLAMRTQ